MLRNSFVESAMESEAGWSLKETAGVPAGSDVVNPVVTDNGKTGDLLLHAGSGNCEQASEQQDILVLKKTTQSSFQFYNLFNAVLMTRSTVAQDFP